MTTNTVNETDGRTHLPALLHPSLGGDDRPNRRRYNVEMKLRGAVQLGAVFSAYRDHSGKYVLVTASGSVFEGLSLKEAANIASFALAAFREGRATA